MYSKEGERRSLELLVASASLEATGFARGVRRVCAKLALIDSAPEPIGRNTDVARAEVPKVVLRRAGVRDDLRCAVRTARWELRVVQVWVTVMMIGRIVTDWGFSSIEQLV